MLLERGFGEREQDDCFIGVDVLFDEFGQVELLHGIGQVVEDEEEGVTRLVEIG